MKSLKLLVCDTCGRVIANPEEGFVEWLCDDKDHSKAYGFRIAHATKFSPLKKNHRHGCYVYGDKAKSDISLKTYMEQSDLLLKYINRETDEGVGYESPHVKDENEFDKLVERLSIILN